ncbi:MAG: HEAT repeat domain-containing protein [Gemmataceae bacterium]
MTAQRQWPVVAALLLTAGCQGQPPYRGKTVAQLERMLHDREATVQVQGAMGLSGHGPAALAAVPALIELFGSDDALVRQHAALALGNIGPDGAEAAVPVLTAALSDPEWIVRRQAAVALARLGPQAQAAVPHLQELTRDPSSVVRTAALQTLNELQP